MRESTSARVALMVFSLLVCLAFLAAFDTTPAIADEGAMSNDLIAATPLDSGAMATAATDAGSAFAYGRSWDDEMAQADVSGFASEGLVAQADSVGIVPYAISATPEQYGSRKLLASVNDLRAKVGAGALAWDDELERCAIQRAAECAVYFSHTRPSGASCFTISSKVNGENIGMSMGYADASAQAFTGWVNSPGHYRNMVQKNFKSMGVGGVCVVRNGYPYYFYVQLFSSGDGSGMSSPMVTGEQNFRIAVPSLAVADMKVDPTVYVGVGQIDMLPSVTLTYRGLSAPDGYLNISGTQTHEAGYFTWDLADTKSASIASNNPMIAGKAVGTTKGTVTLPGNAMSRDFTVKVTNWSRIWGANAYATMQGIVQSCFSNDSCDTVVLATFDGYWDALTASGYAGFAHCPVLMTGSKSLESRTKSEIERLGAKKVVIAGGTAAISTSVENQVKALPGVERVVRAEGSNAAGTACAIYDLAVSEGHRWSDTAIIATAQGYWDALAASPVAYSANSPIFLASDWLADGSTKLNAQTLDKIKKGGFKKIVVCGGTAAVSSQVESQLATIGLSGPSVVTRKAGANAADTSARLASYGLERGMSDKGVAVATLEGYWDALSGAAWCGENNIPLVLASDFNQTALTAYIKPHAKTFEHGVVFGGKAAISEAVYVNLTKLF